MRLRVFTLRYDRSSEQFDDTELRNFIATGVEAIEVREHFFECDGHPVWALLLSYRDTSDTAPMVSRRDASKSGRPETKQELSADEMVRFEAVRAWRNARSSRDGKPPYILLTNRQLAAVAQKDPKSLTALGEVQGIGDGKLHDFGAELLEILTAVRPPSPQSRADTAVAPEHNTQDSHVGLL
jgi:superfamily II DNA helicase RecQ